MTRDCLNSLPLRSIEHGSGPSLLLLHGVTRCGEDWQPLMPELSANWKVNALDQRGHGESPRERDYLVDDYVADTVRLVRDELATPLVIFGHQLHRDRPAEVLQAFAKFACSITLLESSPAE